MLDKTEEQLLKTDNVKFITEEWIENEIVSKDFQKFGRKTTVCCLTLKNGFEVIGTASCVDEQNFDFDKGMEISEKNAREQIWQLEGYLLQEKRFIEN